MRAIKAAARLKGYLDKRLKLWNCTMIVFRGAGLSRANAEVTIMIFSVTVVWAIPCYEASEAMPWDYTLSVLLGILGTYIAPAAIGVAMVGSVLLYTLGGHDELAGRLLGSAVGGCIAIAFVYVLNFFAL